MQKGRNQAKTHQCDGEVKNQKIECKKDVKKKSGLGHRFARWPAARRESPA
jgi:hypothetical protein